MGVNRRDKKRGGGRGGREKIIRRDEQRRGGTWSQWEGALEESSPRCRPAIRPLSVRCPSRQLTCARYIARLPRKIRLLACHQVSAKGRTRSACRRSTRSFLAIDDHRLVLARVSPTPPSAVLPLLEYFSILRFRADTTVIRSHSSTRRVASRGSLPRLLHVFCLRVYEGKLRMGEERPWITTGQCMGSTLTPVSASF